MKIVYGTKNINSKKDFIYITESDLIIDSKLEEFKKVNDIGNQIEKSEINNIRVSNLFKFNDYSLWWFMHPSFSATLRRISSFIDKFEETVEKIDPDGIYVEYDFEKIPIIKQICEKRNIDLKFSKTQYYFYNLKKNLKLLIQPYRFQRITKEKTKIRTSLFKKKYSAIESFTNKIIFSIPTAYRRYNYNPKLKKSIRGEYIQGSIIEILKKMNYDVSCIDLDYTFKGQHNILKERLSESNFWIPIESLVENNSSKNYFQSFIREYQKTIQNKSFKKLFQYKGINFWEIIKYDFQSLSNYTLLPTYIQLIEGLTDFLKNNKPKAVFLPYEVGPLALAIIIACKRNNILTIGLQHGMIWGDNPDYVIGTDDSQKVVAGAVGYLTVGPDSGLLQRRSGDVWVDKPERPTLEAERDVANAFERDAAGRLMFDTLFEQKNEILVLGDKPPLTKADYRAALVIQSKLSYNAITG